MRLARPLLLGLSSAVAALALAACSSASSGWTYAPPPPSTAAPSVSASAVAPSQAASSAPAVSPGESSSGGATGTVVKIAAQNIQFDQTELTAPANQAFTLEFTNNDAGVPHNVAIKDASGAEVFKGEIFNGTDKRDYAVPALQPGTYTFVCTVHPNMTGTLTVK